MISFGRISASNTCFQHRSSGKEEELTIRADLGLEHVDTWQICDYTMSLKIVISMHVGANTEDIQAYSDLYMGKSQLNSPKACLDTSSSSPFFCPIRPNDSYSQPRNNHKVKSQNDWAKFVKTESSIIEKWKQRAPRPLKLGGDPRGLPKGFCLEF